MSSMSGKSVVGADACYCHESVVASFLTNGTNCNESIIKAIFLSFGVPDE